MALRNFYEKTTKIFKIELRFNSVVPDIRGDHISIILKKRKNDLDSEAILYKEADVFSEGESGIAIFTLTPEDTSIPPETYFYEIKWASIDSIYILESDRLSVLDRVFD